MATYPVRTRRWTRAQYDRLIDIGVFLPDEPLELLGGELIVSEPRAALSPRRLASPRTLFAQRRRLAGS